MHLICLNQYSVMNPNNQTEHWVGGDLGSGKTVWRGGCFQLSSTRVIGKKLASCISCYLIRAEKAFGNFHHYLQQPNLKKKKPCYLSSLVLQSIKKKINRRHTVK